MSSLPRIITLLATVVTLLLATILLLGWPDPPGEWLQNQFRWSFNILSRPRTWVVLILILLLENFFPADRQQSSFTRNSALDAFYFFINTPLVLLALDATRPSIDIVMKPWLEGLVIHSAASWSFASVVLISFITADFLGWFHHWVRHKIPLFWQFHAVHHSQTQMSVFTDGRNHPIDVFIAQGLAYLPFFILGSHLTGRISELFWISFIISWYPRFYHANIKTDMGRLRWILVTPQSHRLHHSKEKQHQDCNFGVILCVWDRIFKTHQDSQGESPKTGIQDNRFPMEQSATPHGLVTAYLSQLFYPVYSIFSSRIADHQNRSS